jgi:hypothetical protein
MKPHVVDQRHSTPTALSLAAIGQRLGIDAGSVHKALKKPARSSGDTTAIDDGFAPRRSFARLGVVERQSSPADDDDASSFRADDGMAEAWA